MKKRILSLLLALLTVVSILPAPTFAAEEGNDYSGDIGKYAKLNGKVTVFTVASAPGSEFSYYHEDFKDDTVLRIAEWQLDDGGRLWYRVEFFSGGVVESTFTIDFPEEPWFLQDTSDGVDALTFVEPCEICGKPGCTAIHFYCDRCLKYDCGMDHLRCLACGEVDCQKSHTWCGLCGKFDCGIEHEDPAPDTVPIIPEHPTMTEGAEVSIVDEYGDPVTEEGYILSAGMKASLSAWTDLEGAVSYQWQIRYDSEQDLWANIQGQTGKGILLSPAMVLSILEEQGSTALRCTVTAAGKTMTSAAIPVTVVEASAMTAFAYASGRANSGISTVANDENKVNLIINYVFADGKIAANPWAASLPIGVAYSTADITVPTIAGYTPTIGEGANIGNPTLSGNQLSLSFSAEELKQDHAVTIVYQPAPVNVKVNHHWQNVDDDNYTLHESETLSLVTGTTVGDVHKTYSGFYKLNYEHPTVAADGSTVVDVYYDRHYYLIKFDLSGGYGVDPIYARFGAPIQVGTPTRPGYIFKDWSLNGQTAIDLPKTVPAGNSTYQALWTPGEPVNYTIVYWKENADDTNYSYWTQQTATATPGTRVSGSDSVAPYVNDEEFFTYNDHLTDKNVEIAGDGSSIINVYYNRNYYTLIFYYKGECNIEEHTHGENCERELICGTDGHVHNTSCERTLTCTLREHIHTETCSVQCGLPIHTVHTQDCLSCDKEVHPVHVNDCYTLNCNHICTVDCYSAANSRELRETTRPNQLENVTTDGIHTYSSGGTSNYYLKLGNKWYCAYSRYSNGKRSYEKISHSCDHSCNIATCGTLTCDKPIHPEHTEADGCYTDVIHLQHTDDCYDHTSHSHTEDCYVYECGKVPHKHDSTCYRACTEFVHRHGNACQYGSGNNSEREYEIFRVITAKYEQNISDDWPTADDIPGFAYWTGSGLSSGGQSSKVHTMTSNICISGGNKLLAHYASTKYTLNYWFEHFDQTVTPDGTTYIEYDDRIYKLSEKYSQTAYYGNLSGWGYKDITGMDPATDGDAERSDNTFNLYYIRNRWTLRFHNVSKVVKTQTNIMFEQPLVNYKDSDGNLLSAFVPPYPTDSYEKDTMTFEGWYTTPECFEGTKVDFSTLTMPNNHLTLYAHWVPVSRTVRFFLDEQDMHAETTIPDRMAQVYAASHNGAADSNSPYEKFETRNNVPNKSYLTNVSTPGVSEGYEGHPYKGYTFVGWFYLDENDDEKAFDPANMPVTSDLNLYGKWSSDVLCPYEIRFLLDEDGNGVADVVGGEVVYVADPVTGSTLAGNSRTFSAKGDTTLYAGYQTGYYPHVASHTIDFKAANESGVVFNFLYKSHAPVEYTVKYLEKGTNKELATPENYPNNTKAVVTENFKSINGYMPDAYQKTLVVVPDGENEIIFWYTKDTEHALYQVNHYIQNLDGSGWTEYRSATFTGEIDKLYSASPETITGFTFSDDWTNQYNIVLKTNAYTNTDLPGDVSFNPETDTVSGTLTGNGMQLNLYYTRNTYTYKVQYLEHGTNAVLATEKTETVFYNELVTENAISIEMDMDGDGTNEDFQLYEATSPVQTATITDNSTVITFYYVRCTQNLSVTKTVTGQGADPNQSFEFKLTSQARDFGGANTVYSYQIDGGEQEQIFATNKELSFSLKAGQTITFFNLPTAQYTVTEGTLPLGYYITANSQTCTLTTAAEQHLTFTNTYDPAVLVISKVVDVVEGDTNTPEVADFTFTVQVPETVTGEVRYTVGSATQTATVTDGSLQLTLKKGQTAIFENLPLGSYTVTETDYSAQGYDSNYKADGAADFTAGRTATVELTRGTTKQVQYKNLFPVGDLQISKTVTKEFWKTAWTGDTFTFTVERTNKSLIPDNQYDVYLAGTKQGTAVVQTNGTLQVEISFDASDAEKLNAQGNAVSRVLVIKNLPAGMYAVEETVDADYIQTPIGLTVSSLEIPADTPPTAAFTNTLKRPTGSISLEKELVAADGYTGELDEDMRFSFMLTLLDAPPAEVKVVVNDVEMKLYKGILVFGLKAGEKVTITGLPIGEYRIKEDTVPQYASDFAYHNGTDWVQMASDSENGSLYTDVGVTAGSTEQIKCTNTYPVDRAELIIQKLVTKEDPLETLPEDGFKFTVKLPAGSETSYSYQVYSANDKDVEDYTAIVEDNAFEITLKADQYAVVPDMPVCGYTVTESGDNVSEYNVSYQKYLFDTKETFVPKSVEDAVEGAVSGMSVSGTFTAGKADAVVFINEYKRHLGTLTINKTLNKPTVTPNSSDSDTFLFHIKGTDESNRYIDMDVTIDGASSTTIYDLPLGDYTVTEDTDWNWRYVIKDAAQTATLTVAAPDASVSFENTYSENKWLNFFHNVLNEFPKSN